MSRALARPHSRYVTCEVNLFTEQASRATRRTTFDAAFLWIVRSQNDSFPTESYLISVVSSIDLYRNRIETPRKRKYNLHVFILQKNGSQGVDT